MNDIFQLFISLLIMHRRKASWCDDVKNKIQILDFWAASWDSFHTIVVFYSTVMTFYG